jgi:hypothetical protein
LVKKAKHIIGMMCIAWLLVSLIVPAVVYATNGFGEAVFDESDNQFSKLQIVGAPCPKKHTGYCAYCPSKMGTVLTCKDPVTETVSEWAINSSMIFYGLIVTLISFDFQNLAFFSLVSVIFLTPYLIAVIYLYKLIKDGKIIKIKNFGRKN